MHDLLNVHCVRERGRCTAEDNVWGYYRCVSPTLWYCRPTSNFEKRLQNWTTNKPLVSLLNKSAFCTDTTYIVQQWNNVTVIIILRIILLLSCLSLWQVCLLVCWLNVLVRVAVRSFCSVCVFSFIRATWLEIKLTMISGGHLSWPFSAIYSFASHLLTGAVPAVVVIKRNTQCLIATVI